MNLVSSRQTHPEMVANSYKDILAQQVVGAGPLRHVSITLR